MTARLHLGEARVWRLWRQLSLNIPRCRPRRRRCGNDIPFRVRFFPMRYEATSSTTKMVYGRALTMLCVIREYTRECLAIDLGARLSAWTLGSARIRELW